MDQVKVGFRGTDLRPALICDNVEGLVLDRFSADRAEGGLPPIRLVNTRGAFLRGRPPTENLLPFVSIAGPNTNNLILDPMLMIAGQKTLDIGENVPPDAVYHSAGR
ncbi:MAG: hypothetical protein GXY44_02580 [Phycisphaerales bacterium]|nr:hypothetical protein [Phycisphaerales bacterium]